MDVLAALAWSAAGFILGYLVGRAAREVHEIKEAVVEEKTEQPTPKRPQRSRPETHQVIGIVLVILALGSVMLMTKQLSDRQAEIECRADVLNETISTLDQRGQLASQDRAALDRFMGRVFSPDATAQTARRAYVAYTRAVAANAEERAELAYPEDRC